MITISTAKTPWGFIYLFFLSFFLLKEKGRDPLISTGTKKQYKQNNTYFYWNNIVYAKNKKEGITINNNLYINISEVV